MSLLHQPLFNARLIQKRLQPQPVPEAHQRILQNWAGAIRDESIFRRKETEIRRAFLQNFFVEVLGYTSFGNGSQHFTLNDEQAVGKGSSDTAIGEFGGETERIYAPFELKGPDTRDLDAIMPGRHKSAVQQAWEYAMDTPGCKFLLLSNMLEIRLYAVGHTRAVYERFDLLELADSASEYHRFRLLLGSQHFLSGDTARLLNESAAAEKEVTQKLYADYKDWRLQLIIALAQANDRPLPELITHAQTILDRVIFIAFAEDRRLLPERVLREAFESRNRFAPQPIWENFKGLFAAIDKGNGSDIPAYNGGLFAPDPTVDALVLPDDACRMFKALGDYDFESEISVNVLGHIFEQSISDLEELQELAQTDRFDLKTLEDQTRRKQASVQGKRKQEGVVYTPDHITAFIVEQTLGRYLAERFDALLKDYRDPKVASGGEETVYRKPTRQEAANTPKAIKERITEYHFWQAWRNELASVKIVDPACGSGAFLIAAFDLLDAEYRRVNEQIQAIAGTRDFFDISRDILTGNLYGVDLNPEAIEITKLSLWLKTAQRGKPLESLDANLKVGNSLIAEMGSGAYSTRAFNWREAFPEIFARGGFDIVLGNPPYVRMELIKPFKPYLEKHYQVAADRADLYAYFYEQGVRLLRPGGRLGYISSSTFFKTGSGEPLRRYLLNHARLCALVDFGDLQVFEGVTTYPAIVVLEKTGAPQPQAAIPFLALTDALPDNLSQAFDAAPTMPQGQLGHDSWRLESDTLAALREKLTHGHKTLKQVYGSPLYGIKTGLNDAFVIDRATRDALLRDDPKSAELLKPFLEGKDLKKWRIEPQDLWLIYIPKFTVNIDDYPAIKQHLLPFRAQLEKRATKQEWFELQQAQAAYVPAFEKPKIVYVDISDKPNFSLDKSAAYLANTAYMTASHDLFLLGILMSKCSWFFWKGNSSEIRGGFLRLIRQYVEITPIPAATDEQRDYIAQRAAACQHAAEERRDRIVRFRRLIASRLAPGGLTARLNTKLNEWHALDFPAFRAEVKKQFKVDIPLKEQLEWEDLFRSERDAIARLDADIARAEREIDAAVYALFKLTDEEIALIEAQ